MGENPLPADRSGPPTGAGRLLGRPVYVTAEPGLGGGEVDAWAAAGDAGAGEPPAGFAVRIHLLRTPAELPHRAETPLDPVRTHDATLPARGATTARGSLWEVGDDAAGAQLLVASDEATVVAWDAAGRWTTVEAQAALHLLIAEALRASGLLLLHAAVVARDGLGVALLGPSGAGKSTTLLGATREGWVPICEDLAWIDPVTLAVAGGDRGVRVWPETRDRYAPWLASHSWHRERDGKVLLPYERLAGAAERTARLERLALLTREPAEPGEPAPRREVTLALWEAAGLPLVPAHQQALGPQLASLASRLRGERLPLGHLPPD